MRRVRRIVNEMEFRMWREAKSFRPSADAGTMQRFSLMLHSARMRRDSLSASFAVRHAQAHAAFSKKRIR
ncbi:hypothetical protein WHZ78_25485 [Bradyrhizobium symbiodeficiens]|jgi:hypothetical protein|uniref:hypothetical protein n=1 Tax=Bradyrhizobium symbiodeficiens TaxID=1404367 RepID=UPI0030D270AE